jgi:prevent-host-death family protein
VLRSQDVDQGLPKVGVRELRNQVAAVVRRAGAGERMLITVDGVPVAMLGPIEPSPDGGGVTLDDLIAAGLVEPAGRRDHPAAPDPANVPVDVRVSRVLAEIRGE